MPSEPGNDVSLSLPGGFSLSAHGTLVIIILVMLAAFGAVAWLTHTDSDARRVEHERLTDALEVLTYVNSLPIDERPRLVPPRGLYRYLAPRRNPEGDLR